MKTPFIFRKWTVNITAPILCLVIVMIRNINLVPFYIITSLIILFIEVQNYMQGEYEGGNK